MFTGFLFSNGLVEYFVHYETRCSGKSILPLHPQTITQTHRHVISKLGCPLMGIQKISRDAEGADEVDCCDLTACLKLHECALGS